MISQDQATIFNKAIIVGLSSVNDGNMKKGHQEGDQKTTVGNNRMKFLAKNDIKLNQAVLVNVSYDRTSYSDFKVVTSKDCGKGIEIDGAPIADGLATNHKNVALFLPIADCVGAVMYDPVNQILMVSHLGRHSTEEGAALKSIEFMKSNFAINPSDVMVWLSPAAGKKSYPLFKFDDQGLHEVNKQHFISAGVLENNIEVSSVDTTIDQNYFSHSQFINGKRKTEGRFAIVAMMR